MDGRVLVVAVVTIPQGAADQQRAQHVPLRHEMPKLSFEIPQRFGGRDHCVAETGTVNGIVDEPPTVVDDGIKRGPPQSDAQGKIEDVV
jgi:hypothetical protein